MPDTKIIAQLLNKKSVLELANWIKNQGWKDAAFQLVNAATSVHSSIAFDLQKWFIFSLKIVYN